MKANIKLIKPNNNVDYLWAVDVFGDCEIYGRDPTDWNHSEDNLQMLVTKEKTTEAIYYYHTNRPKITNWTLLFVNAPIHEPLNNRDKPFVAYYKGLTITKFRAIKLPWGQ